MSKNLRAHGKSLTNNVAELSAIFQALKLVATDGMPTVICTDSSYSLNAVCNWSEQWEKDGWKKADKKCVENIELL